jgi:transposase
MANASTSASETLQQDTELMRWMPPPQEPDGVSYAMTVLQIQLEGTSMKKISMLAIDLAKGSFQVCAIGPDGAVLSNRAISRTRLVALLAEQAACVVAMEACATSHHWGRLAQAHGHEVRIVPAAYVKPFVKRQKNDRADAEAIAEAALRPTMRFVAVKSAETQAHAVAFRTHQCLVRQRTQLINALRGHLAEFGLVAPKGPASLKVLETALADETTGLPDPVREMGAVYFEQIANLTEVIERLANELEAASKTDEELRRLCTIPGIGPVTAGAVAAFAPDLDTFDSGRNFAAWLGLVPRQRSTGGKMKLGAVSKMGQTDIRRLLIVGAMSVIRWVVRKGGSTNRWLAALVARKPKMVAAVPLANKMARMIWAMTTKQEDYRMA